MSSDYLRLPRIRTPNGHPDQRAADSAVTAGRGAGASICTGSGRNGGQAAATPREQPRLDVKSRASLGISARYWYQFSGQP
jgi:hypothetical protein